MVGGGVMMVGPATLGGTRQGGRPRTPQTGFGGVTLGVESLPEPPGSRRRLVIPPGVTSLRFSRARASGLACLNCILMGNAEGVLIDLNAGAGPAAWANGQKMALARVRPTTVTQSPTVPKFEKGHFGSDMTLNPY